MNKYVFISPCKVHEVNLDGFMEEVSPEIITPEFVNTVNKACIASLGDPPNLASKIRREEVQGLVIILVFFEKDNELMLKAEFSSENALTPEQLSVVNYCITGQYSDGWGEGFEQRPIHHNGKAYFVSTWFYGEKKWELLKVPNLST